jgi:hypothetical protein
MVFRDGIDFNYPWEVPLEYGERIVGFKSTRVNRTSARHQNFQFVIARLP